MDKDHLIKIANRRILKVIERPDIIMSKGQGMYLYDIEGNEYIDFVGGWAVNCLGHSPKALSGILSEQSRTLINASPAFYNVPMIEYADLLIENCCFDRVFFMSTGAEANEGAIKLARKYGSLKKNGASDIITTGHGFHGRTLTTMSATGKERWDKLFEPKTKGFPKSVFNDIESILGLISEKTCAIMIELIQGEGGVHLASKDYVRELRHICDRENILLIFDEIQTGMGRTGKLFCYEHYDVEPDIMTLGKGIGGGFPLSAMLCKEELNIFDPGDQGGTYTGQPLAMAVGLTVLRELLNEGIIGNSREMGEWIQNTLLDLSDRYEIENIRGKGLLIAFDLMKTKESDFVSKCLKDGLLINSPKENSIRLMPPLIVKKEEVNQMRRVFEKNLAKR